MKKTFKNKNAKNAMSYICILIFIIILEVLVPIKGGIVYYTIFLYTLLILLKLISSIIPKSITYDNNKIILKTNSFFETSKTIYIKDIVDIVTNDNRITFIYNNKNKLQIPYYSFYADDLLDLFKVIKNESRENFPNIDLIFLNIDNNRRRERYSL